MLGLWGFHSSSNDTASCDESSEAGNESPDSEKSQPEAKKFDFPTSTNSEMSQNDLIETRPTNVTPDGEVPDPESIPELTLHNATTEKLGEESTTNGNGGLDLHYDPPPEVASTLMGPPSESDLRRQYLIGIRDVYEVVLDGPTLRFLKDVPMIVDQVPRHAIDLLPPAVNDKPTLVLDMDETLIYALLYLVDDETTEIDPEVLDLGWDLFFAMPSLSVIANVKKRPGVDDFLKEMSKLYEIVVWTAGEKDYADAILDQLDPSGTLISHRLYRRHCTRIMDPDGTSGVFMKDLSSLGRSLSRTCILENSPRNFGFQINNGLAISGYEKVSSVEDEYIFPDDDALKEVSNLLVRLARHGDKFDEHIAAWFRMGEIARSLPPL